MLHCLPLFCDDLMTSFTCTERFKDTVARVEWLTDEDFVVSRIMDHLALRKERVKNEKRLQLAVSWFDEYLDHADRLRAKFDAMQETVLTEEMRRISK